MKFQQVAEDGNELVVEENRKMLGETWGRSVGLELTGKERD
jgi:hypothetical protein